MLGAIDVGSNTVRLLISDPQRRSVSYLRKVTRLSGNFADGCLDTASITRTLAALKEFSKQLAEHQVASYRAVATEAVRRADNRQSFLEMVKEHTGLTLDIISGDTEAELTSSGVLSVMKPIPEAAIIIDIGGGSTELVCVISGQTKLQHSYPLGVVRLCEEFNNKDAREQHIETFIEDYFIRLSQAGLPTEGYQLIGTAGTVTTLSAMQLGLTEYDVDRINNSIIPVSWLASIQSVMDPLTITEREKLPGMEAGRGDLIIPGIQILRTLADKFKRPEIRVSDSGLLEGVITDLAQSL